MTWGEIKVGDVLLDSRDNLCRVVLRVEPFNGDPSTVVIILANLSTAVVRMHAREKVEHVHAVYRVLRGSNVMQTEGT